MKLSAIELYVAATVLGVAGGALALNMLALAGL
jgi:hypothetical protein